MPSSKRKKAPGPSANGEAKPAASALPLAGPEPFVCTSAADLIPAKVSWLWEGRLAFGTVALCDGGKGDGKSTLACAVAADVLGGPRLSGGRKRKLGSVLWYGGEENAPSQTRPKLAAAGAPERTVQFPGLRPDGTWARRLVLPYDLGSLKATIDIFHAVLVVLDPWHSFLSPTISLFDTQQMRATMEGLADVAAQTGCLIWCSRNYRKSDDGPALGHGLGSSEIANVARSVLQLRPHPENTSERVLAVAACSLTAPAAPLCYRFQPHKGWVKIVWTGESGRTAEELAETPPDVGDRDERKDATALLREILAEGPRPANEVLALAQASGIAPRTLRRAKALLKVVSLPEGIRQGGKWIWSAPKGGFPSP